MKLCVFAPLVAVLLVAADQPKKEGDKKDLDLLQGEWKMDSFEGKGKKEATAKNATLTVKGDQWKLGGGAANMTFEIDAAKTPKTIDIITRLDGKEARSLGIYKLEGDTLTVCRMPAGVARPKEFKTTDTGGFLVVWKKVTK